MNKQKLFSKLKKVFKIAFSTLLAVCIVASALLAGFWAYITSTKGDYTLLKGDTKKAFSAEFNEVENYTKTKTAGRSWRDGMIGGNGKLGFVTSG